MEVQLPCLARPHLHLHLLASCKVHILPAALSKCLEWDKHAKCQQGAKPFSADTSADAAALTVAVLPSAARCPCRAKSMKTLRAKGLAGTWQARGGVGMASAYTTLAATATGASFSLPDEQRDSNGDRRVAGNRLQVG